MSQQEEMKNLTLLGNKETPYIFEYSPQVLESFDNRHTDNDYFIKFNCPEFTSLCPITGQPDFASIYISYIPDQLCVESKSLKLYLFSYRNHGDFHENCINTIGKDLVQRACPPWHRQNGVYSGRTHHRPAHCRRAPLDRGAAKTGGRGQYGHRHRA